MASASGLVDAGQPWVLYAARSYDGRIKAGLPDRRQRRSGASQLGQLGVRPHDLYVTRTEGDNHCVVILDRKDPAKAVAIVRYLILHVEPLNRRISRHVIERAIGQEAPGRAVGRLHYCQYGPRRPGTHPSRGSRCPTPGPGQCDSGHPSRVPDQQQAALWT